MADHSLDFDPTAGKVDTGKDTIDAGTSGLRTGDAVVYHHGAGGTDVGGLTDGTTYYVNVQDDGNSSFTTPAPMPMAARRPA